MTFGQRCGRKFHENVSIGVPKLYFCSKLQVFVLDEVLCIYCAMNSVSFLVSPFVQLRWKSKMAAR